MSQENVEVVRRGWEAWTSGDIDALFAVCSPEIEWDTTNFEGWLEADVYRGHAGVRRFLEDWLSTWERFESGVEKYIDVGDDRVLVLCWQRGFGAGSHAPVEMDWAQICTLERGLVCRAEVYASREDAVEAVGLSE